ncbi:SDR family NAD(P)-dependent oxidoreductase [Streptomyces mirabilis]|uniref:SDR family NAD(P)-dependent oxidoreductase n=1 Tax=Streptomyces mirabilis TaxID=68239 RepID=UPI003810DDE3
MSKYSLSEKTVLITGAAGGIGAASARAQHGLGANLVLVGRNASSVAALGRELGEERALSLSVQVTDRTALEKAVACTVDRFAVSGSRRRPPCSAPTSRTRRSLACLGRRKGRPPARASCPAPAACRRVRTRPQGDVSAARPRPLPVWIIPTQLPCTTSSPARAKPARLPYQRRGVGAQLASLFQVTPQATAGAWALDAHSLLSHSSISGSVRLPFWARSSKRGA